MPRFASTQFRKYDSATLSTSRSSKSQVPLLIGHMKDDQSLFLTCSIDLQSQLL